MSNVLKTFKVHTLSNEMRTSSHPYMLVNVSRRPMHQLVTAIHRWYWSAKDGQNFNQILCVNFMSSLTTAGYYNTNE